jgi:hypothetical protein
MSLIYNSLHPNDNLKVQILSAPDLQEVFTWADFGTATERVTSIVYSSTLTSTATLTKTLSYTQVGSTYKLDTIVWTIT